MAGKDRTMMSRSRGSSGLGGRTPDIRTKVPPEIEEDLRRMSREAGYGSMSEYICDVLMVHARGLEEIAKLHMRRLECAARKGQE